MHHIVYQVLRVFTILVHPFLVSCHRFGLHSPSFLFAYFPSIAFTLPSGMPTTAPFIIPIFSHSNPAGFRLELRLYLWLATLIQPIFRHCPLYTYPAAIINYHQIYYPPSYPRRESALRSFFTPPHTSSFNTTLSCLRRFFADIQRRFFLREGSDYYAASQKKTRINIPTHTRKGEHLFHGINEFGNQYRNPYWY